MADENTIYNGKAVNNMVKIYEAQEFDKSSGSCVKNKLAPDASSVGQFGSGSNLCYKGVELTGATTFMAFVRADAGDAGKQIDICIDSESGPVIGSLVLADTDGAFAEQYAALVPVNGVHDVYLCFPQETGASIDWFVFSPYDGTETPTQRDRRMAWWREARFGQFIHFGAYSYLAGDFRGQSSEEYCEWLPYNLKLNMEDYKEDAGKPFNPEQFDAKAIVAAAKDAGQKYLTFTSRHHDGFSMFPTKITRFRPYNLMEYGAYKGPDIIKQLKEECDKQGVVFCLYHTIMDWGHPAAQDYDHLFPDRKKEYIEDLKGTLREVLEWYDPAMLWFDGHWVEWWTFEDGQALYRFLRTIKPEVIINNRIGKEVEDGDYCTPEQYVPELGFDIDWETCMTMNNSWGFNKNDHNWKPVELLITQLVDSVSKGGNYLLNIGPEASGIVPSESLERLHTVGEWMRVNGESIYGAGAGMLTGLPDGVYATRKEGKIYLHLVKWPESGELCVPVAGIKDAQFLCDRSIRIGYTEFGGTSTLRLPKAAPDALIPVLELTM